MFLAEEEQRRIDRNCFVLRIKQEVWIAVVVDYTYYLFDTMEFIEDPDGICPSGKEHRAAWLASQDRRHLVIARDGK